MSDESVLTRRLAAQLVYGPPAGGPLEATRHLLAIQAQDARGARLAIRVRTGGGHVSDVDRALTEERSLVITWANRGTLHLVAAEDEPLLHAMTTPQLRTEGARRLGAHGIDAGLAERGVAAIVASLSGQGPLVRSQLREVLDRVGVPTDGFALTGMLYWATLEGLIVRGPLIGGEHAFVLVADWLGERPVLDRGVALAELARRYLLAHGPAMDRDLARWAAIGLRDARAGLAAIAGELEQQPGGLVQLRRPPAPGGTARPRLLGAFDPLLMGWVDRSFVLGERERDVVTSNGIFRAIALVDGRAAGTWSVVSGRVRLELWDESLPPAAVAGLADEASAVEGYLRTQPVALG